MKDWGCSDADERTVLDSAGFSREHIAQCAKSGHFVVIEAGAPKFPSVELNAMINRFSDSTRQTPALNDDRQLCLSSSMRAAAPLLMIHVVETMLLNGIPQGQAQHTCGGWCQELLIEPSGLFFVSEAA
jgi:hypothetical protein